MEPYASDDRFGTHLSRAMARLARLPPIPAFLGGLGWLALIVLLDSAGRGANLRLVPLYVPILCMTCWALGRHAIWFALVAAAVALVPDVARSATPFGAAVATNAVIRSAAYLFLALIIGAYRRAYDEADYRAMYDGLTGVLNKMPFEAAVVRHRISAERAGQTVLMACVDLDGFKGVNTSYGHKAGDTALRNFAREAQGAIRGSDLVGRLGGDEFGFLMSASSAPGAEALVHVLHQRLNGMLAKTGLPLSCSMGALIVAPQSPLTETDLFGRADALMRRAKADGKSRVITEAAERPDAPVQEPEVDRRARPVRRAAVQPHS